MSLQPEDDLARDPRFFRREPDFYKNQVKQKLSKKAHTVTLRKYNKSLGPKILNLNQKWRKKYETQTTKLWNVFATKNIFTYASMSFVRLSRFNDGIILPRVCSNRNSMNTKRNHSS
jgi:hypothetical protein